MVSKRHIFLGVLVAAFLGGVVWLAVPPVEPVYQGKSLTAWLQQCVDNEELDYEYPPPNYLLEKTKRARARMESEIAIRGIGTNALPYLLKMAAAQDSPFKEWLMALLRKQSLIAIPFRSAMEDQRMAQYDPLAFAIFGRFPVHPADRLRHPLMPHWVLK